MGGPSTGRVNPFAIDVVRGLGYPVENLRSKSWDEFAALGGGEAFLKAERDWGPDVWERYEQEEKARKASRK